MIRFDRVSGQLVLPFACLCFVVVARDQRAAGRLDERGGGTAASSCSIAYPPYLEVVTPQSRSSDSYAYLTCELQLFLSRGSGPGKAIAQCVEPPTDGLAAVRVAPVWEGIHRGIRCNSSHLMEVQVEYPDANGTYVWNDTFVQSRVDSGEEDSRVMYQLVIRTQTFTEDSATVRYTIRRRVTEGCEVTPPASITILILSFRKPSVSDEDGFVGIFTPNGQTEFLALDEVVTVPCLDIGQAYAPPRVYQLHVQVGGDRGNSCLELQPPTFQIDYMVGIHFNMSELPNYSRGGSQFLCCWGNRLKEEGCSPTPHNCVAFSIKDPPDLVVVPETQPPGYYVNLLSTKGDDLLEVALECNYKSPIYMDLFHYKGLPPEEESVGYNSSTSSIKSPPTRWTRHRASAVRAIEVGDSLRVDCLSDLFSPALHTWGYIMRDAGHPTSRRHYLHVSLTASSSENEAPGRGPVFRCESAHADLRLRVIRCVNPLHCRLLEWCFEAEAECGRWDAVRPGEECETADDPTDEDAPKFNANDTSTVHCLEVEVRPSAGLFRCTAGEYTFTQLRWLGLSGLRSYAYRNSDFSNATLKDEIIQMERPEDVLYTHAIYKFTCRVTRFWSGGRLHFQFGFQGNESLLEPVRGAAESGFYIVTENNTHNEWIETRIPSADVKRIICRAPKADTEGVWISTVLAVRVAESEQPRILNDVNVTSFAFAENAPHAIVCESSGQPPPSMKWVSVSSVGEETEIMADQDAEVHVVQAEHKMALTFRRFAAEQAGTYACSARNDLGLDSLEFEVSLLPAESTSVWIIFGGALAGVVLVLGAGVVVARLVFFRPRRIVSEIKMKKFLLGTEDGDGDTAGGERQVVCDDSSSVAPQPGLNCTATAVETEETQDPEQRTEGEVTVNAAPAWQKTVHRQPFDVKFLIERHKFTYDKDNPLGSCQYGKVYAGVVNSVPPVRVAVKVPPPGSSEDLLESYLSEIKIMTKLRHEDIVSLVGVSTARAAFGKLYILMEFCEHGSMDKFFERYACYYVDAEVDDSNGRNAKSETVQPSRYVASIPVGLRFGLADFLRWSMEIASGMEFLSGLGIVHRDLAARNALLTTALKAKVSDFGLARQLYGSPAYTQKTLSLQLPYRWMAPECFEGTFSTFSDVWAYAVLVWEIFSLGKVPYPSVGFTDAQIRQFPTLLGAGLRIREPHRASPEVFAKLNECWNADPESRPSFTKMKDFFSAIIGDDKSKQPI